MLPVKVQIKFAKALLGVNKQAKSTLIIPNMGEMKLIQKYFDPCRKAVDFC
jgi:hypothetical protein